VGRISNAWRLAQASWQVLARDRELIAIPIVAGAAALVAFGIIAGPGVLLLGGTDETEAGDLALWLILAVAAIAATWVAALGQAAVVSGAGQRMDGGDPTLATAFDAARARSGRLFGWAVLATVVALVLLPGIALGAGSIASGVLVVQVVGVGLAAAWVLAVVAVVSALSAVYKTALYRWATKLPVDPAFDASDLTGAFRRRR
jgi:hypothetical protein